MKLNFKVGDYITTNRKTTKAWKLKRLSYYKITNIESFMNSMLTWYDVECIYGVNFSSPYIHQCDMNSFYRIVKSKKKLNKILKIEIFK